MAGRMKMLPKLTHDQKPSEITLSDGRTVLSVQAKASDELVRTKEIKA